MILNTYQFIEQPTRAVIGFHGWTGDEFSMEPIAQSVKAPSTKWFMPRAPYNADTGEGYTWFSGSDKTGWKYEKTLNMMPKLLAHVGNEGFLPEQTFMVGFSMGAGLSILAGSRLSYALGGIVPIAGFVKNSEQFKSGMTQQSLSTPFLIMQGSRDEIVSPDRAEMTVQLLADLGYNVRYESYDAGHKVPKEAMPVIREFIEG